MPYSLEYKTWTNSDVTSDFSIKETSDNLAPETEKDVVCDGIGMIGLIKDADGLLKVKLKSVDGAPSEIVTYFDILHKYKAETPYEEPTVK